MRGRFLAGYELRLRCHSSQLSRCRRQGMPALIRRQRQRTSSPSRPSTPTVNRPMAIRWWTGSPLRSASADAPARRRPLWAPTSTPAIRVKPAPIHVGRPPRRCCACAIRGAGHFVVLSPLAHSLRWTPRKHRCLSRWFWMTAPAACYALATSGAAGLTAWSRHTAAACRAGRMRFWPRLTRTSRRRSTARNRCGGCRPATLVRLPPDSGPAATQGCDRVVRGQHRRLRAALVLIPPALEALRRSLVIAQDSRNRVAESAFANSFPTRSRTR